MSDERDRTDKTVWLDESIDSDARPVADTASVVAVREEGASEPSKETVAEASVTDAETENGRDVHEEGLRTVDRVSGLISSLESASIAPAKASVLKSILKNIRTSLDNAIALLEIRHGDQPQMKTEISSSSSDAVEASQDRPKREMLEGVFNGLVMVGDDGKEYAVAPNYASKSKLVEGDMLKLYIGDRGNFIFKQVGPIERQRLIGSISFDQENGQHTVLAAGRSWKILKATVTYFKADVGDEAVILVPKNAPSKWAAVENIIHRNPDAASGPSL